LERNALGELGEAKVKKLFKKAGLDLPEYAAWEIYEIDPDSSHAVVKGPLASVESMPMKGVFVIYDLPYKKENTGERMEGDFLVDSQGASAYIRFWRKLK